LSKNDTEVKFLLEESNPQFANALRRIMISEVPVMAIDSVDITENDSVLYNEIISHRMGMVPLVFDKEKFHFKEDNEDGKADSLSEVILVINKKGPGMVYSKDIKSSDPDVKPLYDNIPIVELFGDQKLKLEASASLGLAKNHARYQSAIAHYRYFPSAKLNGKLQNPDEVMKACPKNSIKIDGEKVSVNMDCDICKECATKAAKPKGVLEIDGDATKFIFNVESVSGLKPIEIVDSAIDILKTKAKEFGKQVGKL
jgi:DNA-directed RNA polymerase subunit D